MSPQWILLVDGHKVGTQAFDTAGSTTEKTLKDFLQDASVSKVFFDIRNDSDAVFAHYDVALQGTEDVQLMESVTRKTSASRRLLNGLQKCVEDYVVGDSERAKWRWREYKQLFQIVCGGSYEAFKKRPVPADIVAYCVGDV
jgi:exonuclease 3'-5' domain-containing protein 1